MGPGGTDEGEAGMGTGASGHPAPGLRAGGLGPRFLKLPVCRRVCRPPLRAFSKLALGPQPALPVPVHPRCLHASSRAESY